VPRRRQGGARQGTQGRNSNNRTDLQGPKVMEFTGQQYGTRAAQVAAQQAVPASFTPPVPQTPTAPTGPGPVPGPPPGQVVDLLGPTERPGEPLTAGMPFGAGPGPEAMMRDDPDAAAIDRLRMLARATGSPSLMRLLESWEDPDV
jgi:hypothetical protein